MQVDYGPLDDPFPVQIGGAIHFHDDSVTVTAVKKQRSSESFGAFRGIFRGILLESQFFFWQSLSR